jgi:hypothetical protein
MLPVCKFPAAVCARADPEKRKHKEPMTSRHLQEKKN